MTGPRVPPRPTADWDDDVDQALSVLSVQGSSPDPARRPTSHILGVYAWHPDLIRGWMPFSNHLRNSTLPDRIREFAVIRTAWLGRGEYEWSQHVRMSRAAGWLTEEEIAALSEGPTAAAWSAEDRTVVAAIDAMVLERNVPDEIWARLEEQFSRRQLIDLVFTVGTYDMHSMAFATLGLELEPGMTGFPATGADDEEAPA